MSDEGTRYDGPSAAALLIGAGVIGAIVGVILWFGEREERRPNYAVTIVVLVVSAFVILCGVILVASRGSGSVESGPRDTRPIVERMNDRIQRGE